MRRQAANVRTNRVRLCVRQLEDRTVPSTLPPGFAETAITGTISAGTAMEVSPDGKLFVLEQAGTLKVYQMSPSPMLLQTNFFVNTPLTVDSSVERGLLGIAFDPNYMSNRYVYFYYTATTPAVHNRIARFTANSNGDLALAGSQTVLLD